MLLGILYILNKTSDDYRRARLVSGKSNVDFELVHHFRYGLPSCSDEPAVDAMVYLQLICHLVILEENQNAFNAVVKTKTSDTQLTSDIVTPQIYSGEDNVLHDGWGCRRG